jgi:maleate cis-trans isomerase
MTSSPVARIGVLVPDGNTVHEREFAAFPSREVEFRFAGFSYPPGTAADFCSELAARMTAPLATLRHWGAQLVLVGCTTASMTCAGAAQHARIEALAGVPVITAASAVREAIAALKLRRFTVATPYGELGNRVVAGYLESIGAEVVALGGLNLDRSIDVWLREAPSLTPLQLLEFSLRLDTAGSQALYLPCTGIGSIDTIELFERRTGKIALSSVQAGYWASLRRLGIDGRHAGHGRLLASWDF